MFFKLWKGLNAPPEHASTDATFAAPRVSAAWVGSPFYLHLQLEDGPMFDPCRIPGSRSLHERKTATWALLIGETYSTAVHAETRRRPHRGMLPDVDFSRAVPDYSRPSLVRRIIRLIRPGAKTSAKIRIVKTSSASSNETVGERPATTYIARSRTGEADDSVSPVLDAMRSGHLVRSRAA
ncbi:hypothetical protein NKJ55_14540 [Mesorhizobium sp. M0106]|uniref:hypothetical protein n=1 Tax=Mesorhizobium sp. M0106 TaxID=2956880 RepID=UPI0033388A77